MNWTEGVQHFSIASPAVDLSNKETFAVSLPLKKLAVVGTTHETVEIFALPTLSTRTTLVHLSSIPVTTGNAYYALVFADSPQNYLFVIQYEQRTVAVFDVETRTQVGCIAKVYRRSPPTDVAAKGDLVAVLCMNHIVYLYRGPVDGKWEQLSTIDVATHVRVFPRIRLTQDGEYLLATSRGGGRVVRARVSDGTWMPDIASDIDSPSDLVETGDGWLISSSEHNPVYLYRNGERICSIPGTEPVGLLEDAPLTNPESLALLPGVGLLGKVYTTNGFELYVPDDTLAMFNMSPNRVGWMQAVVKGTQRRFLGAGAPTNTKFQ